MHAWDMSGWDWLWMVAMMTFVFGLVAGLVLLVVRGSGTVYVAEPRDTPEDVLRRRLARGEIDGEEYRRLLATLQAPGAAPGQRSAEQGRQTA